MKSVREEAKKAIEQSKIIVIVRGVERDKLAAFGKALVRGGIRAVEIAFDQTGRYPDEQTAKDIYTLSTACEELFVGAGTVLTKKQLALAKASGASFIVSPSTDTAIIRKTVSMGMVSVPGAMTPTEIVSAYTAGADFVKLFPYASLGSGYLRNVHLPLKHIPLLAVGGVTPDNAKDAFDAGAVGVAVAGGLVNLTKINAEQDWDYITATAEKYVNAIAEATK